MKKLIVKRFFLLCVYGLALMLGRFAPAQGFAIQQGFLEPVISRANRPGQIVAIIQNTNTSAANKITMQVPYVTLFVNNVNLSDVRGM